MYIFLKSIQPNHDCHSNEQENEASKDCNEIDHEEGIIIRKILAQNKKISFSLVVCVSGIVSTNNTDSDSTEGYNSTTSREKQIRYEAEESYIQSISKRQQRYNERLS